MKSVDFMQMDPDIIKDFLARGEEKEIHDFVESYLNRIRCPLQSTMFRSYVVLNIRFAVVSFLESIGAGKGRRAVPVLCRNPENSHGDQE